MKAICNKQGTGWNGRLPKPFLLDLKILRTRWLMDLESDNVAIAVFPGEDLSKGYYLAQEFDYELQQLINKKKVN